MSRKGQQTTEPKMTEKPPTRRLARSARDQDMLRVRKTIQNRCLDLSAMDLDRWNQQNGDTSGEVSPQLRHHCSSILVSPWKDEGAVTAEYTGF